MTSNVAGFPRTKNLCLDETNEKITEPQMGPNKFTFFWCNIAEHSVVGRWRVIKHQTTCRSRLPSDENFFPLFVCFPFGRTLLRRAYRCRVQQSMAKSTLFRNEKLLMIIFVQITIQKAEATNLSECLGRFHVDTATSANLVTKFEGTLEHF